MHKNDFNVTMINNTQNSLTFLFKFGSIKLNKDSHIISNAYKKQLGVGISDNSSKSFKSEDQLYEKAGNIKLDYPFAESYTFEDLDSETNYKFNFFLINDNDTHYQVMYANTLFDPTKPIKIQEKKSSKNVLSKTENLLYAYTDMKSHDLDIFHDRKDLKKCILDARLAKNYDEYKKNGWKIAKPPETWENRKKRAWLVANGIEVFDDVNGLNNEKAGFRILDGDWFMGPFFSYDHNIKD